jgi:hypothetical protein
MESGGKVFLLMEGWDIATQDVLISAWKLFEECSGRRGYVKWGLSNPY